MLVMAPSNENECRRMLTTAFHHDGPSAVRYPRGSGPGTPLEPGLEPLPVGKGIIRREGRGLALLAFGSMVTPALAAAASLDATVADMRFVKPLDRELILTLAAEHRLLVSLEENTVIGGAGAEIARLLEEEGIQVEFRRLGLPDRFIDHGDTAALLEELKLGCSGIRGSLDQGS